MNLLWGGDWGGGGVFFWWSWRLILIEDLCNLGIFSGVRWVLDATKCVSHVCGTWGEIEMGKLKWDSVRIWIGEIWPRSECRGWWCFFNHKRHRNHKIFLWNSLSVRPSAPTFGEKVGPASRRYLPSFFLFGFFVFLSRPFAWFAVQFLPHAGGKRFLTTKGTEITKFSDVFIFVSSGAFCGWFDCFEPQMAQVSQNVNLMK